MIHAQSKQLESGEWRLEGGVIMMESSTTSWRELPNV